MSDTTDVQSDQRSSAADGNVTTGPASAAPGTPPNGDTKRRRAGLSGMVLPELQSLAGDLGIAGTGRMRKSDLIAAIQAQQSTGGAPGNGASAQGPGSALTATPIATPAASPESNPPAGDGLPTADRPARSR
ncbi:MAG: Rho termination factor N-terminal domain-containing protein, partial [Actinomycetota bacterium]|nr:Rho termination factor N-terminal domain-containing protein [Actinomycetota bacterium]